MPISTVVKVTVHSRSAHGQIEHDRPVFRVISSHPAQYVVEKETKPIALISILLISTQMGHYEGVTGSDTRRI